MSGQAAYAMEDLASCLYFLQGSPACHSPFNLYVLSNEKECIRGYRGFIHDDRLPENRFSNEIWHFPCGKQYHRYHERHD